MVIVEGDVDYALCYDAVIELLLRILEGEKILWLSFCLRFSHLDFLVDRFYFLTICVFVTMARVRDRKTKNGLSR